LLLEDKHLTWGYVRQILGGEKQLLKKSQITLKEVPPRSAEQS
jgi:hypothetical protein